MGKKIDLTGKILGKLTVIEESVIKKHHRPAWTCRCECGMIKDVSSNSLLNNLVKSCGCLQKETASRIFSKPNGEAAFNSIFKDYKRHAIERNLCFDLTIEQFKNITQQPCYYCGIEPVRVRQVKKSKFVYNGVDRLDNALGYITNNVVACCTVCNGAKSDLNEKEFKEWINRLIAYQTKLN